MKILSNDVKYLHKVIIEFWQIKIHSILIEVLMNVHEIGVSKILIPHFIIIVSLHSF